jgi:hypothetical protein
MSLMTISDARGVGKRRGLDGVVLITLLPDGRWQWASWGRDRRRCQAFAAAAAKLEDTIGEVLADTVGG